MRCSLRFVAALAALLPATLDATSVRPPTFEQVVSRSAQVARGEVIRVQSEWRGAGADRRIVTVVSFQVERLMIGSLTPLLELEFLGGTVGHDVWQIPGQPQFKVGDRAVLFVEGNRAQVCPLVAMMYGAYPLLRDPENGSRELVLRNDGTPLQSVRAIGLPQREAQHRTTKAIRAPLKAPPLTLEEFERAITTEAQRIGRKDVHP